MSLRSGRCGVCRYQFVFQVAAGFRNARVLSWRGLAARAELAFEFPGSAVRLQRFAEPMKAVRRDFDETPPRGGAVRPSADLDDFIADPAANLLFEVLSRGI